MKVTSTKEFQERIFRLLDGEARITVRPERGQYTNPRITLSFSCEEVCIDVHKDGKVRVGHWSVYGNHSFVNGEGCDASGFVVTDQRLLGLIDDTIAMAI